MTNSNTDTQQIPKPPALFSTFTELPRASFEITQLYWQWPFLLMRLPRGNNEPVLTLPGYGANDTSMLFMRKVLETLGYRSYPLALGLHLESKPERIHSVDDANAFREKMARIVEQRIHTIYEETGQKVNLIGWSMGGCYALDATQSISDKLQQVITLGAPFGDPRGTSSWKIMRFLKCSKIADEDMNFDAWLDKTRQQQTVPVSVIYSPNDGIVSEAVARLPEQANIKHYPLDSSHTAFSFNPRVYKAIAYLLAGQTPPSSLLSRN